MSNTLPMTITFEFMAQSAMALLESGSATGKQEGRKIITEMAHALTAIQQGTAFNGDYIKMNARP